MLFEMHSLGYIAVGLVGFIAIFDYIALKLMKNNHIKFAQLGKKLLDSDELSEVQKGYVISLLNDAFQWKFMLFVVFILPVALFAKIRKETTPDFIKDLMGNETFVEFIDLHRKVVFSANTLFTVIFFLELLLLLPLIVICFHGIRQISAIVDFSFSKVSPKVGEEGIPVR